MSDRVYSRDIEFARLHTGGRMCQFCFEDSGMNSEDYTWHVSAVVMLKCDTCGTTNEIEEDDEE